MMKKESNKEHMNLEDLKEQYSLLRTKYALPDFKLLNENFEIENIDVGETELLIKVIRKHITEKIFYILRSLETFINPQNAPLFMFDIIKTFTDAEKQMIKDLYSKIAKYEVEAFGLEASYNENSEAEFVRKFGNEWPKISESLTKIYLAMNKSNKKDSKTSSKSYLG